MVDLLRIAVLAILLLCLIGMVASAAAIVGALAGGASLPSELREATYGDARGTSSFQPFELAPLFLGAVGTSWLSIVATLAISLVGFFIAARIFTWARTVLP